MNAPTIWVRLRLRTALFLVEFFKMRAMKLHQDARNELDPIASLDLRVQADDSDEDAEEIKHVLTGRVKP